MTAYEMCISDWSSDVCSSYLSACNCCTSCSLAATRSLIADSSVPVGRNAVSRLDTSAGMPENCDWISPGSNGSWRANSPSDVAKIGRAHVCTPVTNAHPVCRLLLEQTKYMTYACQCLAIIPCIATQHTAYCYNCLIN